MNQSIGVPLCDLGGQFRELEDELLTAVGRVLRSGQVIQGPEVADFEAGSGPVLRRRLRRRLHFRHRCPVAGPARPGHRPRRRGHLAPLYLLCHRRRRLPDRRQPGLRRHRPRHLQHRSAAGREQDHHRKRGRSCSCTSSASAPTWNRSGTSPSGTTCRSSKTPPRPSAPNTRANAPARLGAHRLLQLLSVEEPRRLRRRRHGRDQRSGVGRAHGLPARPRHGAANITTNISAGTPGSTPCTRPCCASSCRTWTAGSWAAQAAAKRYDALIEEQHLGQFMQRPVVHAQSPACFQSIRGARGRAASATRWCSICKAEQHRLRYLLPDWAAPAAVPGVPRPRTGRFPRHRIGVPQCAGVADVSRNHHGPASPRGAELRRVPA